MQRMWLMVIVILCCMGASGTLGNQLTCKPPPKTTCSTCLSSPGCSWCKQKDFLKQGESNDRRCDSAELLRSRKCPEEDVVNPKPEYHIKKDRPLSNKSGSEIQLTPQSVSLKLRIGQPQEIQVSVKRAVGYPIDLYYLMDLSFSMKDDLEKIKTLGQDILATLKTFTKNIHIGFGSFVDKVTLPYVSMQKDRRANPCPTPLEKCQPAFSFRNILPLTDQAERFEEEVSKQKISGNLDSPEAGLDAIMQSTVCRGEIGWRNVTSILVYTSDDTFHIAGDGRLAGIYRPHDGQCHLDATSTYEGTLQDYPSVGHLSTILQSNNMQLIFAVTEDIYPAYQALSELVPGSVVGVLKNDSSNVVQLISEAYNSLSSSIILEHEQASAGLSISYQSVCEGDQQADWSSRGECSGVKLGQQVDFKVRLNATACLTEKAPVKIKVQGISDVLSVYVETICDCNDELCGAQEETSPHCSGNGTFHCGMCSCYDDNPGLKCDCQLSDDDSLKAVEGCRKTNTSEICGGKGRCECGKCVCLSHFHGNFCECDGRNCPKFNKEVCNNRGACRCDKCICVGGYSGEKCECPPVKQRDCKLEKGQECSGQGKCPCDRCNCNEGIAGQYCDRILEPCGPKYQNCTLCAALGKLEEVECKQRCAGLKPVKMDGPQEYHCTIEGFTFYVSITDGQIHIHYSELPKSIDKTTVIIGSSVTGIIVIGIVIIIVYRLLVELYDMREYRSFLRAQEMSVWKNTDNPLFQGATTTVMNPLHDGVE